MDLNFNFRIIFLSWLVFIGIDFLFHASILADLWKDSQAALKEPGELFALIPFGYLSFLFSTILLYWIHLNFFKEKSAGKDLLRLALSMGILLAGGNFLALYSYVRIPLGTLAIFNLVYFLEIVAVSYFIHLGRFYKNIRYTAITIGLFFVLVLTGIIIQNL